NPRHQQEQQPARLPLHLYFIPLPCSYEIDSLGHRRDCITHSLQKTCREKKLCPHLRLRVILPSNVRQELFGEHIVQIVDAIVTLNNLRNLVNVVSEKTIKNILRHPVNDSRHLSQLGWNANLVLGSPLSHPGYSVGMVRHPFELGSYYSRRK